MGLLLLGVGLGFGLSVNRLADGHGAGASFSRMMSWWRLWLSSGLEVGRSSFGFGNWAVAFGMRPFTADSYDILIGEVKLVAVTTFSMPH